MPRAGLIARPFELALHVRSTDEQVLAFLEDAGADQIRQMLREGKLYRRHQEIANRWLAQKDQEAALLRTESTKRAEALAARQAEAAERAATAAESAAAAAARAATAAESQAAEARRANTRATIALIIATISIAIAMADHVIRWISPR